MPCCLVSILKVNNTSIHLTINCHLVVNTRMKVPDINEGIVRRADALVIGSSVDHRHRREEKGIVKLFRHVIPADRVLKSQVKFVVAFHHFIFTLI